MCNNKARFSRSHQNEVEAHAQFRQLRLLATALIQIELFAQAGIITVQTATAWVNALVQLVESLGPTDHCEIWFTY